jgi:HTH-type transcriptional regulator/antitoxin HigA
MGASLARLIEISKVLNVKLSETFEGRQNSAGSIFSWSDVGDIVWGQFPYKEMTKRGWFSVPHGENSIEYVRDYFLRAAGPQFATAYHRKKMRSGTVPNEYALLAWQARILESARDSGSRRDVPEFQLDDRWITELVGLTKLENGPKLACELLESKGILLITERHLPGTYLDGASMRDEDGRPIIGLTLRHDRLDNFWFVLFHELGHVFLHLYDGLRYDFFDEECAPDNDAIELAADAFALNSLVPDDSWDKCLSRFALSEESVRLDAESLGIHPSIIAGRIRKERNNYTILNALVGHGAVRTQLEAPLDDFE